MIKTEGTDQRAWAMLVTPLWRKILGVKLLARAIMPGVSREAMGTAAGSGTVAGVCKPMKVPP